MTEHESMVDRLQRQLAEKAVTIEQLEERIRRGEQIAYQVLDWMLTHGGAGCPLRLRLKAWHRGEEQSDD